MSAQYTEDSIQTLDWKQHIRLRPGMYIGKLGDGSAHDDGIYVLLKEVIDNSIDEYMMGFGKQIIIKITDRKVEVRDFGRGIPLGKLIDTVSKMNTGAKYDSEVFKKSVGLNGVGIKAVNALSSNFLIKTFREGKARAALFSCGKMLREEERAVKDEPNGVYVAFEPDPEMFGNYRYLDEYVESMLRNYTYLNAGLEITYKDKTFRSERGLLDLLEENMSGTPIYPLIHLKGQDIEIALTHNTQYGEEYYSFVNGQHTTQGGTHLAAFKEAYVKVVRDFYKKNYDAADIRTSIVAALSIKVEEPVFESQTKTKLGSKNISKDGISVAKFIGDFLAKHLDDFLHRNPETARIFEQKIIDSEKDRKAIAGIQKLAKERAKKATLHNRKLRDCRIHFNSNHERRQDSTIFITEGDSASGSITTARDVTTQAVFSLKGKPLNTFGLTKKIVYENEEFNLLQAALNIEESIENLRYNNVVIATDADVDGMHIRLLLLTFFLQFFPDLVKNGHLYILQTPLFRVRNKNNTRYCYNEQEKNKAIKELGQNAQITRFKGLGEISPDEFKFFINKDIRLDPVLLRKTDSIRELLEFYMGKNTPVRQNFIIGNLRYDEDYVKEAETVTP